MWLGGVKKTLHFIYVGRYIVELGMINLVKSGINGEGKIRYALLIGLAVLREENTRGCSRGDGVCRMGNNAMPEEVLPGIGKAFRP